MIVFDLRCSPNGHVFEAWFGSSDDYESQRSRGLVQCPLCGAEAVEKAVMAPRVGAKGNQAPAPTSGVSQVVAAAAAAEAGSDVGAGRAKHTMRKASCPARPPPRPAGHRPCRTSSRPIRPR